MIRLIARLWAKHSYVFQLEAEAAKNLINAGLAEKRAAEKRMYVAHLENEAADIEINIANEVEKDEYNNLTGQKKYEADKEKRGAEKVIEDKRALAKQEAENAKGGEDAAKVFRQNAENARAVAQKIRAL